MHFIIVGSGRVGRILASELLNRDHTVAVISTQGDLLDLLPDQEGLQKINGIAFDADVLKKAGVDNAFGLASVTDDDNMNILVTRIAKGKFHVQKVVVRVYDQSKAAVFEQLGIPTVSTIHWTVNNVLREMIPIGADSQYVDPTGNVALSQVDYDESWCGLPLSQIEKATNARTAFIIRFGKAFYPVGDEILQDGDKLHLLVNVSQKEDVAKVLSRNVKLGIEE